MFDLDLCADRGHALVEQILDRFGTAALAQRNHRRRSEDPQGTAAHGERGIRKRDGDGLFVGDPGGKLRHFLSSFPIKGVR